MDCDIIVCSDSKEAGSKVRALARKISGVRSIDGGKLENARIVEQIFETVLAINKQGVTILLVEQNAAMALSIAGRGYVLETGGISLEGSARNLADNPEVRRAYLGEA